jgi:Domain of unknown function (DUF1996)
MTSWLDRRRAQATRLLAEVIWMRRWRYLLLLALAGCVPALVAVTAGPAIVAGATAASDSRERFATGLRRGGRYFAIGCDFSHRNQDDPIVFPNQSGRSHDHTYFGNTATNASSTAASLRAAGQTTCGLRRDTAAYWAPTLFVSGQPVEPRGAVVYYVRRTVEDVEAFPAGLQVIAGSAAARTPQSQRITFWSCGSRGERSSTVPTCETGRRSNLRLQVNFPNCWDGSRLDSTDHQSHMTYSTEGRCPESHPVEVPALSLVVHYGVAGGSSSELASGGQYSGHADFVNAWDQRTLERLVDRYLNRSRRGGR